MTDQGSRMTEFFKNSMQQTKTSLLGAIQAANNSVVPHRTKINEYHILIDNASSLQTAANRFTEAVDNYHYRRNNSLLEQLGETNTQLENTLGNLAEYMNQNISTKTMSVKKALISASPLLPATVFFLYSKMRPPPPPPIKSAKVDVENHELSLLNMMISDF